MIRQLAVVWLVLVWLVALSGCSDALRRAATAGAWGRTQGDATTAKLEEAYEAAQRAPIEAACGSRRPCPEAAEQVDLVRGRWAKLWRLHDALRRAHEALVLGVVREATGGDGAVVERLEAFLAARRALCAEAGTLGLDVSSLPLCAQSAP